MSFWSPGRAAKPSLAVDLGTAFTRVWARGRGLVSETPSRVRDARPLRGGVVVDVERAAQLLEPLLWRARRFGWGRPAVLACAPSDASPQEVERLRASLCRAGAANVRVEPEPLAAAVGAGVDPGHAQLLADVGAGVADVALLRGGRILRSWALRGDGLADRSAAVADLLRRAWRELSRAESCEVIDSGLLLSGGGALRPGLRERLAAETRLDVHLARDPLHAVIAGAGLLAG